MTFTQIAWHKAGIMREGSACVVSHQVPEAMETLRAQAAAHGAILYEYGKHWAVRKVENAFLFIDQHGTAELPAPALLGDHQLLNAGNAIAAVSLLDEFDISEAHVVAGLHSVRMARPGWNVLRKVTSQQGQR